MIIWLASYPKSGNTWLRSLISTYFYTTDGNFDFDILKFIDQYPSVAYFKKYKDAFSFPESTARYWLSQQEIINKDKKLRFFKTHNAMCRINEFRFTDSSKTKGAIYIVRDPRNIISSLANHYQIDTEEALEFMKNEKKALIEKKDQRYLGFVPIFSWIFHQKSWTECKGFPVLTIRYEDLQFETFNTFKKIFEFIKDTANLKISFDKEKAKKVIRSCEFDQLKKLEKEKGFPEAMTNKVTNEKIKFFNMGKENDYKRLLSSELINKMNSLYKDQLKNYNYE